jgi:hypothetical protein
MKTKTEQNNKKINSFIKNITYSRLFNILEMEFENMFSFSIETTIEESTKNGNKYNGDDYIAKQIIIFYNDVEYSIRLHNWDFTLYINKKFICVEILPLHMNFSKFIIKILLIILKYNNNLNNGDLK